MSDCYDPSLPAVARVYQQYVPWPETTPEKPRDTDTMLRYFQSTATARTDEGRKRWERNRPVEAANFVRSAINRLNELGALAPQHSTPAIQAEIVALYQILLPLADRFLLLAGKIHTAQDLAGLNP